MDEIIRGREQREENYEGAEDGAVTFKGQEGDEMEQTEPEWSGREIGEEPCYCGATEGKKAIVVSIEWSRG